jgi:hypothetical protein
MENYPDGDLYYALYNTKVMNDFIEEFRHNNEVMYKSFDLRIKFLQSKISSLEDEIKELKK